MIYRLFTFHDFFDTMGKLLLYLNQIAKFKIILKQKLTDVPTIYIYIIRNEFFLTHCYVRLFLFKL